MSNIDGLLADLTEEQDALDRVVAPLDEQAWRTPTPAESWQVRDQVSHLAYFDATAALALVAPGRFAEHRRALLAGEVAPGADVAFGRTVGGSRLLADWRTGRGDLHDALAAADGAIRVPWYGPDMSLASFVTARLMETWAHGQDVRDALGLPPSVSDRLRHVCHLGVAARRYAHLVHGVEDDGTPIRVEVTSPDGVLWAWGPEEAEEKITGSALSFALVVTQRRHADDTDLSATGGAARRFLSVAQAFAGPAGPGRRPGLGGARPLLEGA